MKRHNDDCTCFECMEEEGWGEEEWYIEKSIKYSPKDIHIRLEKVKKN